MSMASIPYTGSIRHNCSTEDPTQRRGNKKKVYTVCKRLEAAGAMQKLLGYTS